MIEAILVILACQQQPDRAVCVPVYEFRLDVRDMAHCQEIGKATMRRMNPEVPEGTNLRGACLPDPNTET